jgi:hypothetical protein
MLSTCTFVCLSSIYSLNSIALAVFDVCMKGSRLQHQLETVRGQGLFSDANVRFAAASGHLHHCTIEKNTV